LKPEMWDTIIDFSEQYHSEVEAWDVRYNNRFLRAISQRSWSLRCEIQ
jgi:hypothetical protein